MNSLRTLAFLGLLAAALAASAQTTDTYSTLGYSVALSEGIDRSPATLFAAAVSGPLAGFQLQMFNATATPAPFNVRLFANVPPTSTGATDTEGAQLAAFTGLAAANNRNQIVSVAATGVSLVAGTSYWLQVDGTLNGGTGSDVAFFRVTGAPATTIRIGGTYSTNAQPNAFSVQVASANPTPEPSALAALGLGAVAVLRRRKRA